MIGWRSGAYHAFDLIGMHSVEEHRFAGGYPVVRYSRNPRFRRYETVALQELVPVVVTRICWELSDVRTRVLRGQQLLGQGRSHPLLQVDARRHDCLRRDA